MGLIFIYLSFKKRNEYKVCNMNVHWNNDGGEGVKQILVSLNRICCYLWRCCLFGSGAKKRETDEHYHIKFPSAVEGLLWNTR